MAFRYLASMRAIVVLPVAGISGKDHVHVDLGDLQALSLAALLGLHVFGDVTHITLDLIQTDDPSSSASHRVHIAAVLLGQQRQQVKGVAAVHGHAQPAVLRRQRGGRAVGGVSSASSTYSAIAR